LKEEELVAKKHFKMNYEKANKNEPDSAVKSGSP
jgi:hypothetical protein